MDDFRDPDVRYSDPQNATLNRIHQSGRAEIWHDFRGPKISNLGPENRPKITFSTFGRRHLAGSEKSILCAKSSFSGFQKWVWGGDQGDRLYYISHISGFGIYGVFREKKGYMGFRIY